MKKFAATLLASGLLPMAGFAHEGHGHTHGFTITHYLVEPDHALLTWIPLAIAIFYMFSKKKVKRVG